MMVRIFRSGTSRGESPVNYLLSDVDHQGEERDVAPEVLEGSPATTISVINGISRKHKYVSGVIAFRDEEQPTREQMFQVIDAFKASMLPGLEPEQYNSLWVLHREKGNTELHFVVPMVELTTGRRLNIHPPGERNLALYETFTQVMNQTLGYGQVVSDPLKLGLSDFERKAPAGADGKRQADTLMQEIRRAVKSGAVNNRDELCRFLDDDLGCTITRKGADYLSVKPPGQKKALRLRGPLFEDGSDYQTLLSAKSGKTGPVLLTGPEFEQAQATLAALVQERAHDNQKAYRLRTGTNATAQASRNAQGWAAPQPIRAAAASPAPKQPFIQGGIHMKKTNPPTGNTPPAGGKTPPMKVDPTVAELIDKVLAIVRQISPRQNQAPAVQPPSKPLVKANVNLIRNKAFNAAGNNSAIGIETIQALESAITEVNIAMSEASAAVMSAKTPKDREKARQRLWQLELQLRKLNEQLGNVKKANAARLKS